MTLAIIVIALVVIVVFGALGIWGLSEAIDRGIKDYIDYAKKDKDRGSHRRT